jgi:hypothetical protein
MRRHPQAAFFGAALIFFAAPGVRGAWFSGVPLGLGAIVALTLIGFVCWVGDDERSARLPRIALALLALAAIKIAAGALAPATGWLGQYYANGMFERQPRRSTEFPRLAGATRIDPRIDFRDDYLPLYFLNEADFNRGNRREVTEPVSVAWTGHFAATGAMPMRLEMDVRGQASVAIDGRDVLHAAGSEAEAPLGGLKAGDHIVAVRYTKPANTDPLVRLNGVDAVVTPFPTAPWRIRALRLLLPLAWIVDFLALGLIAFQASTLLRRGAWTPARVGAAAMLALFVVQGAAAATPFQRRAVSLSGGDDWMSYEAQSRAVATGDFLMQYGQPPGKAEVLYYYPGYIYFLAAMHAIGSEDLSTLIFSHFVLLWAANVVVYLIGARLFDRRVAFAAVAALVAIEEIAFMRHYTVTLLSENLYFFTVALTVYAFVRFVEGGRRTALAACAIAAGLSALTRPAMMLYLVPASLVVYAASFRLKRRHVAAASAAAAFAAIWLATVSPATLRNYIAAGSPVLICTAPAAGFINYNLPPNVDGQLYRNRYDGSTLSLISILGGIAVHYPLDTLRSVWTKIGFSFGMVQWMGGHWHPELLLASAGYLLAVLFIPSARAAATWPIHAFVIAHLAGMALTMPSNYGYRLILPMYLFFPLFGARAAAELRSRLVG